LNKMRAVYKARHDILLNQLKPLLGMCYITGEHAGVHLLLHFVDGRSEAELIALAAKRDIKVYGLSEYYGKVQKKQEATIILGYANLLEDDIVKAAKILCEVWK